MPARAPGNVVLSLLLVSSCGASSSPPKGAGETPDARVDHVTLPVDAHERDATTLDASTVEASDARSSCHGSLAAADRARWIVVSHPFDESQNAASDFELFSLSETGVITESNAHFSLGPTTDGKIAFTPDGAVGVVAEDDGTLGVFRIDANGTPTVVSASHMGNYYATSVVMDPSGDRAYVLDDDTVNNGGGIYAVSIACDGTLTDDGLLVAADLPASIVPLDGGTAVVAAKNLNGTPPLVDGGPIALAPEAGLDAGADGSSGLVGNDAVLVPWPIAPKALGTANPFGDDLAIVSSATVTRDGHYVLLGDNSQFSGVPNRVGIVRVTTMGIVAGGVVQNVNDPETIVASPFDDTLLVTSAFGNALFVLGPSTDGGSTPFAFLGTVQYKGASPQLPGAAVMVDRGSLQGRVLVAENQAIRQVQFATMGVVSDLGPTATGNPNDLTSIVGAIGVQP